MQYRADYTTKLSLQFGPLASNVRCALNDRMWGAWNSVVFSAVRYREVDICKKLGAQSSLCVIFSRLEFARGLGSGRDRYCGNRYDCVMPYMFVYIRLSTELSSSFHPISLRYRDETKKHYINGLKVRDASSLPVSMSYF